MGAPGIQPLGIQQAMMCIACLQQPVPMKYAGVYDNICQCQLFVSSFWRPIRKLRCAHGTALKVIVTRAGRRVQITFWMGCVWNSIFWQTNCFAVP